MSGAGTALPLEEDEDLVLVRDSARALLLEAWPPAKAVAAARQPHMLHALWRQAAAQGWTALGLDGEAEMGLGAALVLMQELGRAACAVPLADGVLAQAALAASKDDAAAAMRAALHQGKALASWVFGPHSGDADDFAVTATQVLDGHAAFVENAAAATHFLVVTGRPGEIAIVARASAGLAVTETPGLAVPALSRLDFAAVAPLAFVQTRFDLATLPALMRLLLAARATGAAQQGLELLTDYAKVRSQFGKKIGQYQAIAHKLANCLMSVDICRLALLRAGKASQAQRPYAAAVASANAGQLLRQVVLELHHGFGGVSFWEEHEMPRHFRRIHADLTRLGGVQRARLDLMREVQALGRLPDMSYGEDADLFRERVRGWLAANWDHTYPPESYAGPVNHRKARRDFSQKLGRQNWLSLTWPLEDGGLAQPPLDQLAFEEELSYAEAPVTWHNTSVNMIAPALISFASPAHKAAFLPAIASGEMSIALGYSEPDHGSDLAGIKTSATRTDTGWVIRGQKIYTSAAGFSTHVWLAVRTDPAQPRHGGISVFMVPLDTPGITVQPMQGLNGHASAVVFYDDVKVPPDALVGEENGGWKIITEALTFERVALGAIGARARGYYDRLLACVLASRRNGQPMIDDPLVRDRLGAFAADVDAARLLAVQTAQVVQRGRVPLHEAAMLKVHASELMERLSEAAFDLLGSGATLHAGADGALVDGAFEYGVRDALLFTIGGGTNEIQRNLIAARGLDLPR